MYGEDVEFCFQSRRKGLPTRFGRWACIFQKQCLLNFILCFMNIISIDADLLLCRSIVKDGGGEDHFPGR
jgi:hypothetical protein